MKMTHKVLLFLVLGAIVLAAGLVPALVLSFAVTTTTTASTCTYISNYNENTNNLCYDSNS